MPIVVVNDVEVEAEVGENLLDIARRCAAHIGFACGGLGICLSCVCRVTEGLEHLSPPNNVERRGIPKPWLDRGHRVACQVTLTGEGPVTIISRPEELFRLAKESWRPSEETDRTQAVIELSKFVLDMSLQQWLIFPFNSLNAVYQATKARPTPTMVRDVVEDTGRVLRQMGVLDQNEQGEQGQDEEQGVETDTAGTADTAPPPARRTGKARDTDTPAPAASPKTTSDEE